MGEEETRRDTPPEPPSPRAKRDGTCRARVLTRPPQDSGCYHWQMVNRLAQVAQIYNRAADEGLPPARQVEVELDAPRTTVAKWVRRAKDEGLIPDKSFAGSRANPKLQNVARALGISPADLARAIREHAGGDLRIR